MEMFYVLLSILQVIGISLGVGCSTVAITSFFVAIADGTIDPQERKMLGVVYILLRVAMVTILITTALLCLLFLQDASFDSYTNPFSVSRWLLIGVLFGNALLMTKHLMPSIFGPAIQAGSWYTLGVTTALVPLGLTSFSFFEFFIGYIAALALAVSLVNGTMAYLKSKK
jgi:hypothetical protein